MKTTRTKDTPVSDVPLKIKASATSERTFLEAYGGIYEHSPWVAKGAWTARDGSNLDTVGGLHGAMEVTVAAADEASQLKLIGAHPDLAGKLAVAGELTAASRSEQTGAGLDRCTKQEFEEFQNLNSAYKEKFGFPFIIAVKGHDRHSILKAFRTRLPNDRAIERETALQEINRIGHFRLMELVENS